MNYLWLGKNLAEAIASPILFVDGRAVIKAEPGFDQVPRHNPAVVPSQVLP